MNSKFALITFLGGGEYPDQGLPGGPPQRPDQGLPGGPQHPDQGLPGGPPSHPWFPGAPLPPHGSTLPVPPPVTPDNTLPPSAPPPHISLPIVLPSPPAGATLPVEPTQKFELKWSARFGWVLVPVETGAQPKK